MLAARGERRVHHHQHGDLLGHERADACCREVAGAGGGTVGEAEGGSQPQARAQGRHEERQAHRRDPGGGPPGEPAERCRGQLARVPLLAVGEPPEDEVRDDDHDAREHRGGGRPEEPAPRLEDTGEDHADPVERQLDGEDPQEVRRDLGLRAGPDPGEQADERTGEDREGHAERDQDEDCPGEER